jgi:predicted NBD/HSP70 family sugar kinase
MAGAARPGRAAADLGYLRDYNEALVLGVVRGLPAFDRAGVATATGLTPQAVSKVLARLIDQGFVAPAGVVRHGVGKPTATYRVVPSSRYAIGAHVGRGNLRLVLADFTGDVLACEVTELPADFTPAQLLRALQSGRDTLVRAHQLAPGRIAGMGVGMVGPLDHARGIVRDAHRLQHWHDVPLRELAEAALGLPVHLDKDVTAGVTGEAWRRGAELRHAVLIMVQSGIGAGLWLDGAAYRGAHTNAGEFGHTVIELDGPRCVCGRHGCLEIVHDTAAAAGDLPRACRVLSTGIVNLLQTVDVDHVILTGTDVFQHADQYLHEVRRAVRTEVPRADWLPVEVSLSTLGEDAIAAGAAMQVLNARFGLPVREAAGPGAAARPGIVPEAVPSG